MSTLETRKQTGARGPCWLPWIRELSVRLKPTPSSRGTKTPEHPVFWKAWEWGLISTGLGRIPFVSGITSPYIGALWGSDLFGAEEMSVCKKHMCYITVWQPRCWTGPRKVARHITQWDGSVYARKTAGEAEAGGAKALSLFRAVGWPFPWLLILILKKRTSPLQMMAQVHCSFLVSISFIFLYYFSYFDQSSNKISNKSSLK